MSSPGRLVGLQCVALWDYDALDEDELSFKKGDTITIVEVDDGFFRGTLGSAVGWFQDDFVKLLMMTPRETDELEPGAVAVPSSDQQAHLSVSGTSNSSSNKKKSKSKHGTASRGKSSSSHSKKSSSSSSKSKPKSKSRKSEHSISSSSSSSSSKKKDKKKRSGGSTRHRKSGSRTSKGSSRTGGDSSSSSAAQTDLSATSLSVAAIASPPAGTHDEEDEEDDSYDEEYDADEVLVPPPGLATVTSVAGLQAQAARQAEERTVKEAEEKARREAEEKARREAEEKARREAEEKARREAEEKAKREAEEKAKREAEEKAKREAEEKARREAEEKAKREAEEKARQEAEEKARQEAEEKARQEAEEKARQEAEEKARQEAEEKARQEAEEKAKREAELQAQKAADEERRKAEAEAEAAAAAALVVPAPPPPDENSRSSTAAVAGAVPVGAGKDADRLVAISAQNQANIVELVNFLMGALDKKQYKFARRFYKKLWPQLDADLLNANAGWTDPSVGSLVSTMVQRYAAEVEHNPLPAGLAARLAMCANDLSVDSSTLAKLRQDAAPPPSPRERTPNMGAPRGHVRSSSSAGVSKPASPGSTPSAIAAQPATVSAASGARLTPAASASAVLSLQVRAKFDYTATRKDMLSFKKGDVFLLKKRVKKEWWLGVKDGKPGFFPAPYVEVIEEDSQNLLAEDLVTLPSPRGSSSTKPPPRKVRSIANLQAVSPQPADSLQRHATTSAHQSHAMSAQYSYPVPVGAGSPTWMHPPGVVIPQIPAAYAYPGSTAAAPGGYWSPHQHPAHQNHHTAYSQPWQQPQQQSQQQQHSSQQLYPHTHGHHTPPS